MFEFIFSRAQPGLDSIFHKASHQKMLPYNIFDVEDYTAFCSHGIVVEGISRQASNLRVRVLNLFSLTTTRSLAEHARICETNLGPQTIPHNSLLIQRHFYLADLVKCTQEQVIPKFMPYLDCKTV